MPIRTSAPSKGLPRWSSTLSAEQVCPGETVELSLTWPDATTTWPDGSEGDTWDAPEVSGLATVTTAEGCEEDVAVDVIDHSIEAPNLGPDQTVCPGRIRDPRCRQSSSAGRCVEHR